MLSTGREALWREQFSLAPTTNQSRVLLSSSASGASAGGKPEKKRAKKLASSAMLCEVTRWLKCRRLGERSLVRKLKPQKVKTIYVSKAKHSVEVFLDRDKLDFFAELGLEQVRHPTVEGVVQAAFKQWKDWMPEVWEEVILVNPKLLDYSNISAGRIDAQHVGMSLEFLRKEVSKKLDGSQIERMHRLDREEAVRRVPREYRKQKALDLETVSRCFGDDDYVQVPYSDAAWQNLCAIRDQIEELARRAQKIFERKDFPKLINSSSLKLLPGAKS